MFGHLPEIGILLVVGLLVFGPKRVIEMGSTVGKMVREFRESTKDLKWSNLLSMDEPLTPRPTYTPPTSYSPPAEPTDGAPYTPSPPPADARVVDGTITERNQDEPR